MNWKLRNNYWWLLPVLLSGTVYVNSLKGDFFWDDRALIWGNPLIKNWTSSLSIFLPRYWKEKHMAKGQYRPLRSLSFTLDYSIWHTNPFGYRLTNVTLHMACTALIAALAYTLFGSASAALLAGLFFAVHPAHIESIDYVKNRSDLLCALFFLSSFLLWLRGKRVFSILSCLLSITGKEMGAVLPFVLGAYVLLMVPRDQRREKFRSLIPFFAVFVSFLVWKFAVLKPSGASEQEIISYISGVNPLRLIVSTYRAYLLLLFFPFRLSVDRILPVLSSLFSVKALIFYTGAAWAVFSIGRTEKRKEYYFALLWILLTLGPVSNIIPLKGRPFAEQRLYLPSAGWAFFMGMLSEGLINAGAWKKGALLLTAALLCVWGFMIVKQNVIWQDEEKVWFRATRDDPMNFRAWLALASAKMRKGDMPESKRIYHRILPRLRGKQLEGIYLNLGVIAQSEGDFRTALDYFLKARELMPGNYELWSNIGAMHYMMNEWDKAEEAFLEAVRIETGPLSAGAYNNLGLLYKSRGEIKKAAEYFRKAVELNSDLMEARINLVNIYDELGMRQQAERERREIELRLKTGAALQDYNPAIEFSEETR